MLCLTDNSIVAAFYGKEGSYLSLGILGEHPLLELLGVDFLTYLTHGNQTGGR